MPPPPLPPCLTDPINATANDTLCDGVNGTIPGSTDSLATGRRLQGGPGWPPTPFGTIKIALDVILSNPRADGAAVVYFMGVLPF